MRTLKNYLIAAGLAFGINYSANAQNDTIFLNKTYSIVEEKTKKDGAILEKKEYVLERNSQEKNGKTIFEVETKYSFKEKNIGKTSDPKEPKNLLNRKQIDKLLDYRIISEYNYDSLGRVTELGKIEDYNPGEDKKKRVKIYYTYEGKNENPVKIWEDLNNDGKYNKGDKIKVYISELDKWVSQEE
ncbi:MAG TPA: hypothetical protein VJA20_03200 [Candidatus Nanoarchaeia archaeon]|nr:hypothetical protein [Candidatus Nanoarchaeia archaeon]